MVVGLMGILKAGDAYLPLDPNYPRERLAFMLADAGCPVLVTQQGLLERLPPAALAGGAAAPASNASITRNSGCRDSDRAGLSTSTSRSNGSSA